MKRCEKTLMRLKFTTRHEKMMILALFCSDFSENLRKHECQKAFTRNQSRERGRQTITHDIEAINLQSDKVYWMG